MVPAARSPARSTVTLPAFTANISTEPPASTTPSATKERGQRHRLRQQDADHGGDRLREIGEVNQVERVAAGDERHQHEPANHRNDDQRLEQGVGDELDQDDLPIRGRHQGAALEGELQQSSHSTMTKRMTLPPFVTRAVARLAAGGLVAAAAIAIAAVVIERTQLGGDLETSRARLKAEVEGEFAALTNRLDTAVRAVSLDPDVLRLADQGDQAARRRLFEQVMAAAESPNVALAVYGGTNEPVAWTGRSETSRRSPDRTRVALPRTKHAGPAAGPRPARARSVRCRRATSARSSRRRRCPVPAAPRSPGRSSRSRPASCRWPCGCRSKVGAETDPGRVHHSLALGRAAGGGDRVGRRPRRGAAADSRSPARRRAHPGGAAAPALHRCAA